MLLPGGIFLSAWVVTTWGSHLANVASSIFTWFSPVIVCKIVDSLGCRYSMWSVSEASKHRSRSSWKLHASTWNKIGSPIAKTFFGSIRFNLEASEGFGFENRFLNIFWWGISICSRLSNYCGGISTVSFLTRIICWELNLERPCVKSSQRSSFVI